MQQVRNALALAEEAETNVYLVLVSDLNRGIAKSMIRIGDTAEDVVTRSIDEDSLEDGCLISIIRLDYDLTIIDPMSDEGEYGVLEVGEHSIVQLTSPGSEDLN